MAIKICTKCILDTTILDIKFDENGVCNFCELHKALEKKYPIDEALLQQIIDEIKNRGKNKRYDCVIGVSGGVDSTYLIYMAKKWGLRPLAVHLDNGWNSDIAENNLQQIVKKLDVDLRIEKVNRDEFRELQIAFLKASVPDIEIPTDVGIYVTLYKVASEEDIPSIINGHSFRTEGTQPLSWTYMEGKYVESVYRQFSGRHLKHFSNLKIKNLIYYILIKRIKEYRPLEYMIYDKKEAAKVINKEINWQDYGGHHFESIYTRFVASYILPTKFNIDKRKVTFSAQIRSGLLSRKDALNIIRKEYYPRDKIENDKNYILEKLKISEKQFNEIMNLPIKNHLYYPTYHSTIRRMKLFIKLACILKLLPDVVYEKYAK